MQWRKSVERQSPPTKSKGRATRQMPVRRGLVNLIIYLGIGIGLAAGALFLAFFLPSISRAWFTFFGATVFLCWFVSSMYWQRRRSPKLWALLALLLVAHIVVHALVLGRFPQFPTILFLLIVPVEVMLAAGIVRMCLGVMPNQVKL